MAWYLESDSTFVERAALCWNSAVTKTSAAMHEIDDNMPDPAMSITLDKAPVGPGPALVEGHRTLSATHFKVKQWRARAGSKVRRVYASRNTLLTEYIEYLIESLHMDSHLLYDSLNYLQGISRYHWYRLVHLTECATDCHD